MSRFRSEGSEKSVAIDKVDHEKSDSFAKRLSDKIKKKLLGTIEAHPLITSIFLKVLIEFTPDNFESSSIYIDEIIQALEENRQVILMGPHWSVVDPICFAKVVFAVNRRYKEIAKQQGIPKDQVKQIGVIAPASSKFFDKERMSATAFVNAFRYLNLFFVRVVQLQDVELRASLSDKEIDDINNSAWLQIIRKMKKGFLFGIFPQATRSKDAGIQQVPNDVNVILMRLIEQNALVVPVATMSDEFGMTKVQESLNLHEWPEVIIGEPTTWKDIITISQIINCLPSEVAPIMIAAAEDNKLTEAGKPKKYSGELDEQVHNYQLLLIDYGTLREYLKFVHSEEID